MALMFDSVNPGAFPATGFDATAGYVDGLYNNTAAIRARFPNLPHVTIAVFARDDAMCLDVEQGDATPTEAVVWLDRQYAQGVPKPILYCNTSTIAAVRAAVGSRPFWWWAADYTGTPHLPAGADACQFTDHGPNGENVDQTLMSDAFFSFIGGTLTTTYRGVTVDPRTAAMLAAVNDLLPTIPFYPSQGSYNTSVAASGGTHSGGGAADIALYVNATDITDDQARQIETAARRVGFAAWYRTAIPNVWPRHVHMIAVGCSDLSPAAAQQVADYNAGRDGLLPRDSAGLSINPDTGTRAYVGATWETYVPPRPPAPKKKKVAMLVITNGTGFALVCGQKVIALQDPASVSALTNAGVPVAQLTQADYDSVFHRLA